MNPKLKRVVGAIALVLILVCTVSLILYLYDKNMLNGAIGDLALWSGAFGLLLVVVLWLSHAFPYQQVKDEERDRLYKEAEEADLKKWREEHPDEPAEEEEQEGDGEGEKGENEGESENNAPAEKDE